MQNYKNLCGNDTMAWFEIQPKDEKKFLGWAKSLGCVWLNGDEINPKKRVGFIHFSICDDGTLGIVPIFAWVSKRPKVNNIRRYVCKFTQEAHVQLDNY